MSPLYQGFDTFQGTVELTHYSEEVTTVFRCLSRFKIETNIYLEWSVWADLSCKTFENE